MLDCSAGRNAMWERLSADVAQEFSPENKKCFLLERVATPDDCSLLALDDRMTSPPSRPADGTLLRVDIIIKSRCPEKKGCGRPSQ